MTIPSGFFAYPARPPQIGQNVRASIDAIRTERAPLAVTSWEENDIAGRFLSQPILRNIEASDFLVADITFLNFNVVFEVGYAIGRQKRIILVRNAALNGSDDLIREVGLFDTLGYETYAQSTELTAILRRVSDFRPIPLDAFQVNSSAPVYLLLPKQKTDIEVRLASRLKKARLQFRTFDPEEQGRLAAVEAIENVSQSHGVVVSLLPRLRLDAEVHNIRAAFVAGLTLAMERELLLLQEGEDPVPLDYRDLVCSVRFPEQIDQHVADFAPEISARFQASEPVSPTEPRTFLERLNLGASSAENELQELGQYYLETDEFRRAQRGEVRVVTGRKGAGKTALFSQLRDRIRRDRTKLVLDLKPEGFQLIKLRERVLDYLEEGTREHTITAFWEYLLLLELCHKLLEKDRETHMRDHRLYEPYRLLAETYYDSDYAIDGDFSERMLALTQRIADDFDASHRDAHQLRLSSGEITELLHRHNVSVLRNRVAEYLEHKNGVWILFDNLDKGWPAHGVTSQDVLTLRSLIEAMRKIEHELQRRDVECHGVVFIRNDVYELLVHDSPDRGKIASITLDWTDADLLRELLRRRFEYGGAERGASFEEIWRRIAVTHIRGEETSQYLIERSLMRPRALIELLRFCRSRAVNLGHSQIEVADIEQGEEAYATELLSNINYEIRDVHPSAGDALYELLGASELLLGSDVRDLLLRVVSEDEWEKLFDLLLWYGVLGVVRDDGETSYIYSVKYDIKRLRVLALRGELSGTMFRVNPAFWRALEIRH